MRLITLASGPDSTRMGPIPPCVGLILVKLSGEGILLIIKPSFSFLLLSFSSVLPGRCHGKNRKMGVFPKNGMPTTTLKKKTGKKKAQ